jgi:hypothetical protein
MQILYNRRGTPHRFAYTFPRIHPRATPIELRKKPDLVILSKPDIYDRDMAINNFILFYKFSIVRNFKAFSAYVPE